MNRLALPLAIVIAATSLSVAEFAYRYPQLPDRVAAHFNAGGQADGWMPRRQFTTTWFVGVAILAFTFTMACVAIWVSPVAAINLPRKDYWLSPERAPTARRMAVERMLWFMAALMLLMAYLSHEVLEVNLKGAGQLTVWTPLGVFLAFTVLWCGELIWRFNRAPPESAG